MSHGPFAAARSASTMDVHTALQSVECVDPLGEHADGARTRVDATST